MRNILTAWLLGLTMCVAARQARAEPQTLQVLAISSEGAFDQSQALTIALKRVVNRQKGLALGSGDFSLEVMLVALNCTEPPDPKCFERIGTKVGSTRFVWGTMELKGKNVLADLHLWDTDHNAANAQVSYSRNLNDPSDETLLGIADKALKRLIIDAGGTLVLSTGTVNGKVLVDGEPKGSVKAGKVELVLPAGEHEVRVQASGYDDALSKVTVPSGGRTELELVPIKKSGGLGAGTVDASLDVSPAEASAPLGGYLLLGSGVALLGGGVYSLLRVRSINEDDGFERYRRGLSAEQDVCYEARRQREVRDAPPPDSIQDQCASAQFFEILQYVFFGLGAAATGTGAYLILSHDSKPAHHALQRRRVQPSFAAGPTSARLGVRLLF